MTKRCAALGLGLVLVFGCTTRPKVTDTGYTGTWAKGNEFSRSTISILRKGDRVWFRWGVSSQNDKWSVKCTWDGRCEETDNGKKLSEYTFKTWVDKKTDRVMVEASRLLFKPEKRTIHWIDELRVAPGGKTLYSFTIERDEDKWVAGTGPQYTFEKVADSIGTPPPDSHD